MKDEISNISHLADKKNSKLNQLPQNSGNDSLVERIGEMLDSRLAAHFQEQNDMLKTSVGKLIQELDGVRRGEADSAFARVADPGCTPDLPTVAVDSSVLYPHSAAEIGEILGLSANEVGTLLGTRGLGWVDNPKYMECDRYKPGRTRFWHRDVPALLEDILTNPPVDRLRDINPRIKAIFRKFRRGRGLAQIVALNDGTV